MIASNDRGHAPGVAVASTRPQSDIAGGTVARVALMGEADHLENNPRRLLEAVNVGMSRVAIAARLQRFLSSLIPKDGRAR
jgi:hypothetical protein